MRLVCGIHLKSGLARTLIEPISFLVSVILVITITACDRSPNYSPIGETGSVDKQVSVQDHNNQVLHIASDIILTSQQYNDIEYRFSAKSVLVRPRSFGGLGILDLNELYVYNSHIEFFPSHEVKNARQSKQGLVENISELLKKYADSISANYGTISRLHMEDVRITMVGAGAEGLDIVITAERLTKDFRNNKSPKLYDVSFSEKGSSKELLVSHAIWNLDDKQFILK